VVLTLGGPDAKPHYYLLESDKKQIDDGYGAELEWRENADKKESGIWLRNDMNPADRASWPEQHKWLLEQLEKFHQVFAPRIKVLDAERYTPEEVPDN